MCCNLASLAYLFNYYSGWHSRQLAGFWLAKLAHPKSDRSALYMLCGSGYYTANNMCFE